MDVGQYLISDFCYYAQNNGHIKACLPRLLGTYIMSNNNDAMLGGMVGNLLSAVHEKYGNEMAAYEEELRSDPVRFAETYAHFIDFSYRERRQYEKALSFSHAIPAIKKQLFKYAEDEIYEIRQCLSAFDGIAGSLRETGQFDKAIECYQEYIQICEVLYTRNKEIWWTDYDDALSGLYIVYLNEGMPGTALPFIHQCIELYEQHHKNPEYTWVTDNYQAVYEDLLYALQETGNSEELTHCLKKEKELFKKE